MKRDIKFCDLKLINAPFRNQIKESVEKILNEGRFIGGAFVDDFEKHMAALVGTNHCIGVGNGLDALKLSLTALIIDGHLKPGDEILVPANTYIASVLAIIHSGLKPVPVDIEPSTLIVSAHTLAKKITPATKGVMLVHLYGRVAWDKEIKELITRNSLVVVEDNAQAIGARGDTNGLFSNSGMSGALGHTGAFSFYPTKNIGAIGDAGAVTTDIESLSAIIRALGNYGSLKRFRNIYMGFNSRLDPIQAAAISHKLPYIDKINSLRRRNAGILDSHITDAGWLNKPLYKPNDASMVWHQYVITLDEGISREHFMAFLKTKGIQTDIHYPYIPFEQPCFHNLYDDSVRDMIALRISRNIVSLPVNQSLSVEDMEYIAYIVNQYQS